MKILGRRIGEKEGEKWKSQMYRRSEEEKEKREREVKREANNAGLRQRSLELPKPQSCSPDKDLQVVLSGRILVKHPHHVLNIHHH